MHDHTRHGHRSVASPHSRCRAGTMARTRAGRVGASAGLEEHRLMATEPTQVPGDGPPLVPPAGTPQYTEPPDAQAPAKHRSAWMWVSGLLAIVAVGLLVWALSAQSDLDSTQQ